MMSGWICLHRDIIDHWVFQDADKLRAWIDLLIMANWEDKQWCDGFEVISIPRGSFITSQVQLAERWGKSRRWVQLFLDMLKNAQMLEHKSSTRHTFLTILNYAQYQDVPRPSEQQRSSGGAAAEQQRSSGGAQLNNITNKQYNKDPHGNAREDESVINSEDERCPLTETEYHELSIQFSPEAVDATQPIVEAHLRAGGHPKPKEPVNYLRKWMLRDRTERRGFFNVPAFDVSGINPGNKGPQRTRSAQNVQATVDCVNRILQEEAEHEQS